MGTIRPVGQTAVAWRAAFDFHPQPGGLNARTNLYYLETRDQGRTWTNAAGEAVKTPLTEIDNPALVHDYQAEKQLVYLKQLHFDADGHPVILYETSRGYAPGPANDPRVWKLTRWTGKALGDERRHQLRPQLRLRLALLRSRRLWRLIAPTEPVRSPSGPAETW